MGDTPPTVNLARRGSLSLTQTLSLDWAPPPPPPADLEQIHASSSQAPGLTSFSLGSPPAGNTEQLSLNKLYSRVKSIAGVVRGVVGSSSSGSRKSPLSAKFGSDQYYQQSASRDSFMSNTTASDDNASFRSPTKTSVFSKSHLRNYSFTSKHSRSSSRVSSNASIASTTDYAQPAALRKFTVTPRLTTPAVAQVTVFRDGSEAMYDGGGSAGASRNSSINNLQNLGNNGSNMNIGTSNHSTVGALVGAVESVISPTAGFGSGASGNPAQTLDSGTNASRNGDFMDADEYFDDSASDETLSDSSDDDVVLLHSKLPAGAARGRPPQESRDRNTRESNLKPKTRASTTSAARRGSSSETHLPPPATSNSATSPDSNMLMPNVSHPPISITSPPMPVKADSNLPQLSALNLQSKAPSRVNLRPPSMGRDGRKDAHHRKKRSTDQSLLLPGFKITGDRSSDADSSPAGTSMTGTDQKGEATSSVYRQGAFSDLGSGKMVNYVNAGGVTGSTEAVSQALRQLRMGNLTRDFWMKDEVCKDCFLCGATFSAWRRKHHCRLCGQIFCSKCTNLISGDKFGHQGSMRVCSPCLDIVNDYHDDSDSDDFSPSAVFRRPTVDNPKAISTPVEGSSSTGYKMPQNLRPGQTPLMAMPATRTTAGSNPNRRSQILEFNDIPSPPRPTSARSIKSFPRPVTAGSTKADEKRRQRLLPTHADSILDPDLAPYMSDEDASDEQQISVFATIAPKVTETVAAPSGADNTGESIPVLSAKEIPPGGSIGRVRRRSKSRGSISGLGAVLTGSESPGVGNDKTGIPAKRTSRRRGSSFIAPLQQRPVTRGKTRGLMRSLAEGVAGQTSNPLPGAPVAPAPRGVARGTSMRGPLAPNVELNTASLEHVKKLLKQLLSDAEIPNVEQWEKALIPILLKCTDDLNPDIRAGDDIDIRHYVKVKKIPGAKPGDTSYISGVVFSKNLALKSMSRNISQPRIAILTFPIEYSRHQQQLMSLQPVIEQEKEFLQNMINRIVALRPTLLLVEKNVSGLALALLAQANVATAYLVKPSVIEAVARCAEADIFSSIDKLALSNFRLGRCASFDVKTFVHNDIPGKKKTFMYLSGCQRELGCTIVLRGADNNTLAIIKQITELMVYVVYNLKLETCLMRDEFVLIPSSPTGPVAPTAPLSVDQLPDDIPNPTYYEDMVRIHEAKILSASPFVSYMQPYLLTRARELERKLVYLRRLRDSLAALEGKPKPQDNFLLVDPEAVHGEGEVKRGTSKKANEVLRAIYDAEYDKALHVYETQKKQWENYLAQYDDLFDPFAHQSITVLYSMVCTETTVPCEGPDIRQLEFYYQDHECEFMRSDCTLGQYIEYLCDTADVTCRSSCDRRMIQHHRSYVHGQARVSVLVSDQIACPIEGMQNTILMWSYCKKCPNTNTPAIPMSESSWKYSFGKYLELAFWSSEMKIRAGNCPHDVNRDHVRCFGYRGLTVLFQHDLIDLLEIVVPRTKITFKPEIDLRVKNEQYTQNEAKIKRFFASVQARLRGINVESASPSKVEACKAEIEYLINQARDDEDWLVAKLQEKYNKSKYYEIIPLNRALRALQEKVVDWDANFSAFDSQYFPSEKDIRRLATQYLKKIFLDNTSTTSLQSENEPTPMQEKEEGTRANSIDGANPSDTNALPQFPSESTPDVLVSTVEEEEQTNERDDEVSAIPRLDNSRRRPPPSFSRTVSVPEVPRRKDLAGPASAGIGRRSPTMPMKKGTIVGKTTEKIRNEKKLEKSRLSSLAKKPKEKETQSQIPRSIPATNIGLKRPIATPPTRVSNLAKHFEQLSKEFERERAREKRQLAAKRARALPVATSRPIVEVYKNVREAVEEGSDEEQPPGLATKESDVDADVDGEADADASDGEMSMVSDQETMVVPSISDVLPPTLGLPQQHRSAWMKMLSNFWAERSASGWTSLEYPLHPTDHVFNDSDIIVREDEPSSLIAFTLNCSDYVQKLKDIRHSDYSHIGNERPTSSEEQVHSHSFNLQEHPELERSLLKTTGTHLKYQFQEGTAKMFCKIFYAEQFDALRRNCGVADRYVESLSRCIKWDSKGGKTRSVFLKTQDERIVLKSLSPVETAAFIKFAPAYFQFMSEAFFHELPTVIAKMLGFYQIMIKNPSTGTEIKWDILVMENLFYDRKTTRIFDLKGSMRNRYMQSTGEQNEVLLDENMVEFIYESPLFVREHSKKLLRVSLHNDTLFLQKQDVMDYSLMIGIDENRKELCVGIIDCIRTFTLDKKLESWVKEKGFAGGGRNKPTITSPKEYKHRFREAMERYVLEAPRFVVPLLSGDDKELTGLSSCWHLFKMNYVNALPLQLHSAQSAAKGREMEMSVQGNEIAADDGEAASASASQPEDVATH
ncbi:hypothetical protein BZA05DRAFT_329983 [Tricharina praecox]|uniref:uncharacterized protein n=1 Tax=Tricharina praecox TaxID=43433 RepID=UPI00221E6DB1|nr:uncharacterized protein BZA05DRAFT_329983 [Tricharina praecox]KAI5858716.1 hypothetical protein BZA05DRAFT_329983 [Tricharina praecox]